MIKLNTLYQKYFKNLLEESIINNQNTEFPVCIRCSKEAQVTENKVIKSCRGGRVHQLKSLTNTLNYCIGAVNTNKKVGKTVFKMYYYLHAIFPKYKQLFHCSRFSIFKHLEWKATKMSFSIS